ncbi:hypothetical protein J4410_06450 [Candidatus Woesearchaeota archaeon]|nr:hypothetical protein [Candidatus Woesearchaeota archaeon]
MSSGVETPVKVSLKDLEGSVDLGRLLAQARRGDAGEEDLSFLEELFSKDGKDWTSEQVSRVEELKERFPLATFYNIDEDTYTPRQLVRYLTSCISSLIVPPSERKYLRNTIKQLEESNLSPDQINGLTDVLLGIKERQREERDGAVFTPLFSHPDAFVQRVIEYASRRRLSSDYEIFPGEITRVYENHFKSPERWKQFSDDLLLHAPDAHQEKYRSALVKLKEFFSRIDPAKHEIVALGYARPKG